MKLKDITIAEWTTALFIFGILLSYIFWAYNIERYEKFMRAGAANKVIWRQLNADAMGLKGDLSALSNEELGIRTNPVRCEDDLDNVEFPAKCRIFDNNNGGKAVNCDYWWLGRNCRIVYMSKGVYESAILKAGFFKALEAPCHILPNPDRVKTGNLVRDEINAGFWSGFGCDSRLEILAVETLVVLRDGNKSKQIRRIRKRSE